MKQLVRRTQLANGVQLQLHVKLNNANYTQLLKHVKQMLLVHGMATTVDLTKQLSVLQEESLNLLLQNELLQKSLQSKR